MATNLGTSTNTLGTAYGYNRKIHKTSEGKLILLAIINNYVSYKTSTDNGDTWDSSWTSVVQVHANHSFESCMDDNNDVLLVYRPFTSQYHKFRKLIYSAGSWSIGTEYNIWSTSFCTGDCLARRANDELWVTYNTEAFSQAIYSRYSIDEGQNWTEKSLSGLGAFVSAISLISKGSNIWAITVLSNGSLRIYEYTTSWSLLTTLESSGIKAKKEALGTLKISDTEIWITAVKTDGSIVVYKYNGSTWDSGTTLSLNGTDYTNPSIASINGNPVVCWVEYSGSQYDIAYRKFNGSTWESMVKVTNDATIDYYPSVNLLDDNLIYIVWRQGDSSPYNIYFDKALLGNTLQKTILSDAHILVTNVQKTITSDAYITTSIQKTILSDAEIIARNQKNITSSAEISPIYQSKFIVRDKLYIVTNTSPAKIIEVDIEPATPTYNIYTLNASGESLNYGTDLAINLTYGYLYASFADGYAAKADLSNFNNRTQYYVGETNNLLNITLLKDFRYTYLGSDEVTGEIFVLDEANVSKLNLDFRFLIETEKIINTYVNTVFGLKLNSDFRFLLQQTPTINTDFRFQLSGEPVYIKREDFDVKIDNVSVPDILLASIDINHVADNSSTATFDLPRFHDNFNYTQDNILSDISNQNEVKIYLRGVLVFEGNISKLSCDSQDEKVTVYCEGEEWKKNLTTINLNLSETTRRLNIYDVLVDDIEIDNPIIDPDDENPKKYKGVKVDLGTHIIERDGKWFVISSAVSPEEIEDGTFIFKPNAVYFWEVSYRDYNLPGFFSGQARYNAYIGTSLAPMSGGMYEILSAHYNYQIIEDDIEIELGEYTIGQAPFKEVSTKNGKYSPVTRWEDDEVGWWDVFSESYDYIDFAKKVAQKEYDRLKNINGDILPITSTTIDITLDSYLYNNLALLTRINLEKTIGSDIYKNNNGFPVSIKNININSSRMTTILTCDNQWSQWETDIFHAYPEEPEVVEGWRRLHRFKTYLPSDTEYFS